ncbi:MAG: hypothetical protein ACK52P_08935 [Alphaproteobacteria bacterium]
MFLPRGYYTIKQAADRLLYEAKCGRVEIECCLNEGSDISDARHEIGVALASKTLRAAGLITHNGRLEAISDSFWRSPDCKEAIEADSAISSIEFDDGIWTDVWPLIAMKDLQICFSIEGHFDRARVWPAAWGVDSPFVDSAKAAAENVSAASVNAPASLNPISQNEADILNPDGRSVLLPKREFMDAAELLSWIAFRRSLTLEEWGNELYKISRNWPFRIESFYDAAGVDQGPFGIPGGPATLRDALSAEVDGAGWRDGALLASAVGQSATEHAIQSLLSEFSASDLLAELTANLSRAERVNPKLRSASGLARRALAAGEIRSVGGAPPTSNHGSFFWSDLPFGRTAIDPAEWCVGTKLLPDGRMSEVGRGTRWISVLFDPLEVLRVFPPGDDTATDQAPRASDDQPLTVPEASVPKRGAGRQQSGGRPPHRAQDAFIRELVRLADLDRLPEAPLHTQKEMMEWVALEFGDDAPSLTTVKDWLQRFDYRRHRKSD